MMRIFEAGLGTAAAMGLLLTGCGGKESDAASETGIVSITGLDDGGGTLGGDTEGGSGSGQVSGGTMDDSGGGANDSMAPKFDVDPSGGGSGGPNNSCGTDPAVDDDGDGFTEQEGDCNDCDGNVNPGAIEVEITEPDMTGMIPDPADEDCDGLIDNVPPPCDGGLALDSGDPYDAAAAMELCKVAAGPTDWGIVNAQFVRANGAATASGLQNGIMPSFGPNVQPQGGNQVLVLSSGHARIPGQPNACGSLTCAMSGSGTAPPGFPQDVPACPGSSAIYDDIALEVTLRAPTNATGFSYNFDFYSFEYPEWVCTSFNDQYIALMNPAPMGAINGNISFDAMTNPVSVNIAFFDVCAGCALGTSELSGTGFDTWDDAGATSWLVTTAPVTPGAEFTIRFAIWDTGDQAWDSTAILDNFQWIADGGSVSVGTVPEG